MGRRHERPRVLVVLGNIGVGKEIFYNDFELISNSNDEGDMGAFPLKKKRKYIVMSRTPSTTIGKTKGDGKDKREAGIVKIGKTPFFLRKSNIVVM